MLTVARRRSDVNKHKAQCIISRLLETHASTENL